MRLEDQGRSGMSTDASRLRKSCSTVGDRHALCAVPDPSTEGFAQLLAELAVATDYERTSVSFDDAWHQLRADEEAILALGLPVALAVGDELPEVADEDVDVHEAAVLNIQTARLHRYLREMAPFDSKVIRLVWGIGCRPQTQAETATTTGASRAAVGRALQRGMRELRLRFGVLSPDAA